MNKYQEVLDNLENLAYHGGEKGGNVKVIQELVERATPKEFYVDLATLNVAELHCPSCMALIGFEGCDKKSDNISPLIHYCQYCGQALEPAAEVKTIRHEEALEKIQRNITEALDLVVHGNATKAKLIELETNTYDMVNMLREVVKRATPIEHHLTKVVGFEEADPKMRFSVCPHCLAVIVTGRNEYPNFCSSCGHAIDWKDKVNAVQP